MKELKLGSLFDGSGGFPLAGSLFGIKPVWASEIEPFPIRVTKLRFPEMKHLGSVTDINGAAIEPVDIITFGSPCQDLSVAGKQAGIHDGERSNLFFEAIRIIREMRGVSADQYPRFAVWENVPGAFSSNKGADFQAVLEALCRIKKPDVSVPQPMGGWKPAGLIVGDGFSIAWRVYDAQYWGVPQRRKRIYLIADFASERAGEILFECESVPGNSKQGCETGERTSNNVERSIGRSDTACGFSGSQGSKAGSIGWWGYHQLLEQDKNSMCAICLEGNWIDRETKQNGSGWREDISYTLDVADRHAVCFAIDAVSSNSMKSDNPKSGFHEEHIARTLNCHQDPTCNQGGNVIVCLNDQGGAVMDVSDKSGCLRAQEHGHQPVVCYGIDQQGGKGNANYCENLAPTLCAISHGTPNAVCYGIENHANDSRVKLQGPDEACQTLTSRMGTGGGNVPMILENYSGNGIAATLDASYYKGPGARNGKEREFLIENGKPPRKYIVRRLTPTECGRLQGFPDWWPDGADGSDSAIYKMWGNGIALPCAADVLGRIAKELQRSNE